jgi:hypothetical protein
MSNNNTNVKIVAPLISYVLVGVICHHPPVFLSVNRKRKDDLRVQPIICLSREEGTKKKQNTQHVFSSALLMTSKHFFFSLFLCVKYFVLPRIRDDVFQADSL